MPIVIITKIYSKVLDPIIFTISFIYNRKSKGPTIDPCGTPENMKFHLEDAPGRTTVCLLLER